MNLAELSLAADALLARYGLDSKGWSFGYADLPHSAGAADFSSRSIALSAAYAAAASPYRARMVLLHEIAHAIAGPQAGHGREWKNICYSIGGDANPEAPPLRFFF